MKTRLFRLSERRYSMVLRLLNLEKTSIVRTFPQFTLTRTLGFLKDLSTNHQVKSILDTERELSARLGMRIRQQRHYFGMFLYL